MARNVAKPNKMNYKLSLNITKDESFEKSKTIPGNVHYLNGENRSVSPKMLVPLNIYLFKIQNKTLKKGVKCFQS